jgi:hypothetical protein
MISTTFRRACACLTLLGFASLGIPDTAPATPTITSFKIEAVPIPGFSGTGDILDAGTIIQGQLTISGTEYGGFPSPLTGIKFYAPTGAKIHPQGFATCAPSVIEQVGPKRCPKRSIAGPTGRVLGVVSFGGERVPEAASVRPFFAPGDKVTIFVDGTTPALLEVLGTAHVVNSAPPFGVEFTGEVPLIETVPEAPDASFEEGTVGIGAAYRQGKRAVYYVTMPKTCPKRGWPTKVELGFLSGAMAEASYTMPCPKG